MAGTDIKYNTILFKDVLTRDINQEVIPDSTGLNPLYVRIVIEADVTIIAESVTGSLGFTSTRSLASTLSFVQTKIMEPRREFVMTIGGVTLFNVRATENEVSGKASPDRPLSTLDVNNGPKASLNVREIISQKVARATFRIEMAVPNCGAEAIIGPSGQSGTKKVGDGLISLRYWTNDDVDENWYTTRTFHGRLRVASKNFNPHSFKNVIFPPLADGFKRESITTQEDPNGLELEFTVIDKEFYVSCPSPATTWRGTHNVSTPFIGGIIGESEVRVELEGPRSTGKTELVTLGVNIIDSKLQLNTFALASIEGEGRAVLMYYAVSESLEKNRVTVTARVRHTTGSTGKGNIFTDTVGQLLVLTDRDYNQNKSRGFLPTALSGEVLQNLGTSCNVKFLKDAASGVAKLSPNPDSGFEAHGKETSVDQTVGELQNYTAFYSEDQAQDLYNYYTISTEYDIDQGTVGLPVGSTSSSSSPAVSQVFVQLHEPVGDMIVRVVGERMNAPPEIPRPQASYTDKAGINHTLLSWNITPAAVAFAGDGRSQVFHVEAEIRYGLSRAPDLLKDKLEIGHNPAIDRARVTTELPTDMFKTRQYPGK